MARLYKHGILIAQYHNSIFGLFQLRFKLYTNKTGNLILLRKVRDKWRIASDIDSFLAVVGNSQWYTLISTVNCEDVITYIKGE